MTRKGFFAESCENKHWRTFFYKFRAAWIKKQSISQRLITEYFFDSWGTCLISGSHHIFTRIGVIHFHIKQKINNFQTTVSDLMDLVYFPHILTSAPCSWPQSDLWVWTSVKIICFTNFSLSTAFSGMCGFADVLYHEKLSECLFTDWESCVWLGHP